MLRDVMAPGPWRERVKHLIMPPDWQREGHTAIRTWSVTPHSIALDAKPTRPATPGDD